MSHSGLNAKYSRKVENAEKVPCHTNQMSASNFLGGRRYPHTDVGIHQSLCKVVIKFVEVIFIDLGRVFMNFRS